VTTTYTYKVRDRAGRILEGSLDGANERLVLDKLRELGYTPVSITENRRSALKRELSLGRNKVGLRDLVVFSRQLATMVNSGLSILRALAILADQTESSTLAGIISEMKGDIERGMSLSQALARHPKAFPLLYRSMVRAGEIGGVLDGVLLRLATMLEKQLELRGKIRSAMTYPAAVGVIIVLIVAAMLAFIVPTFEGMYSTMGGTLPVPTRLLIGASNGFTKFWWLVTGLIVGAVVAFKRWVRTEHGRLRWDTMALRAPVFGRLKHKTAIARFTRSLSSLLRAGVQAVEALEMVADTAGNALVAVALRDTAMRVRRGESLASSMGTHPVLPPMVVQMVAVGEETGALDDLLERIADFYERDVDAMVSSLTSLIEPMLMAVMGTVVGGMVVALYMPMFKLLSLVH
jgi:type IV pilus assembly protein PilC